MGNRKKKWEKWRTPRGNQSKLRMHNKDRGLMPRIGYGRQASMRGMHPSGLKDVIVNNVDQLRWTVSASKNYLVRIAAGVGKLKRKQIQDEAEKLKVRIANPKKIELRKKEKKVAVGEIAAEKLVK